MSLQTSPEGATSLDQDHGWRWDMVTNLLAGMLHFLLPGGFLPRPHPRPALPRPAPPPPTHPRPLTQGRHREWILGGAALCSVDQPV